MISIVSYPLSSGWSFLPASARLLAHFAGVSARTTQPATREYVETIFDKMDDDGSGTLDRDEFADVMAVLCGQVMTRVVLQWSMTLMIVPLLAQFVLDGVVWANKSALEFWAQVDAVHLAWDHIVDIVSEFAEEHVPSMLWKAWDEACRYWTMVPESVLEVLPLTLLSCVLGGIAVPYMLFKIDDFFHGMADKKRDGKKKKA
uniref:EF-hand domain-containing protein n=1 Tax=Odontella aurita TaxID=265563 RepID=A0A7S4M4V9_9STRA|mmetsp:Transcript_10979/g.32522  ORF Transcript_10979/g.32522 Transcript_10979/m.32522 type:complete len:202 (+) Transcript_10979:98-703(+)